MSSQTPAANSIPSSDHPPAVRRYSAALVRYVVPTAALFAAGPVAYSISNALSSATGTGNTSFLLAQSMGAGLTALVASLALACIFVAPGSALIGAKAGLLSGGYVFGWAAWGTGDLSMLLRGTQNLAAGTLITLVVEAAVIAIGCLAMLILASKLDRHPKASMRDYSARAFVKELVSVGGLVPVLAAVAGAVVATIFIAHSGLKGQTVFAALLAGIAAAVAAHAASSSETPHPYAPFFGVALAAILSPVVMMVYPGVSELPKVVAGDELLGYFRLQPSDWSVALLIGVPIGLGWTGALMPHNEEMH